MAPAGGREAVRARPAGTWEGASSVRPGTRPCKVDTGNDDLERLCVLLPPPTQSARWLAAVLCRGAGAAGWPPCSDANARASARRGERAWAAKDNACRPCCCYLGYNPAAVPPSSYLCVVQLPRCSVGSWQLLYIALLGLALSPSLPSPRAVDDVVQARRSVARQEASVAGRRPSLFTPVSNCIPPTPCSDFAPRGGKGRIALHWACPAPQALSRVL
ncbi:hypothetical protein CDD83_11202 [Cordyceps sp. RAO-2017]|nr:hypothetical protein CDD83_11202 [Cordyceps sp. RAO-2017]